MPTALQDAFAAWHFAWPLAFLLLGLPFLAALGRRGRVGTSAGSGAIRLPFAGALPAAGDDAGDDAGNNERKATGYDGRNATDKGRRGIAWRRGLAWFAYGLLVIVAARPQWIEPAAFRPASGRDLLLMLDVSASMGGRDLQLAGAAVSRLDAAKKLARGFLEGRRGDRVGLVVFARRPYLYVPLSHDLGAVSAALDAAEVGLAGRETAIGEAVALAVRTLAGGPDEAPPSAGGAPATPRPARPGSVVVLLTDGANTAGSLSPQQAAWVAARRGVRVHALAIGAQADAATLGELATQTGGHFARAVEAAALAGFFRTIDALEPVAREAAAPARRIEAYFWPLVFAVALLLVAALPTRVGRRSFAAAPTPAEAQ